jgi:hypothetical protein
MRMTIAVLAIAISLLAQSPQSLADVHTIFVDSLGSGEHSGLIRDKLINRLAASKRFQVVLDADKADAILTGSGAAVPGAGTAAIRLVTKEQQILWAYEANSTRLARSASSSLAERIVNELLKAAAPSKKK